MNIKNLNLMSVNKVFSCIILMMLYSCGNNEVSFDSKKQAIISDYRLSKIIIENLNTGEIGRAHV